MEQEDRNTTYIQNKSYQTIDNNSVVTILIPISIVLLLLITCVVIAWMLYKITRKKNQKMSVILIPRAPVIFTSEPGRVEEDELMQKRLFSDEEDNIHTDYQDRKQLVRKKTSDTIIRQEGRIFTRQTPSYWDRQGR